MSTLTPGRRGFWLAIALAAAAMVLAFAATRGTASGTTDSFSGSCMTQGTVAFSPPVVQSTQQLITVVYTATGTCSGTLDGKSISNAPVKLQHSGQADASCGHAQTTAPGSGDIYFDNGVVIPYKFTFNSVTTEIAFSYTGQKSGSANGHGSFATQRTSATDVFAECNGKGATQIPMDMQLATESPLVSDHPGGTSSGGGGGTGGGGSGGGGKPPTHSTTSHSRRVTHHVRVSR